jgi:molybdenum cofactor biosynthesis enzyme MoaA
VNPAVAGLLARVTRRVFVSPETLDDAALKTLGKPFSTRQAAQNIHMLAQAGAQVVAHFIDEIPGQTRSDRLTAISRSQQLAGETGAALHFQRFVPRQALRVDTPRRTNIYDLFAPDAAPDHWTRVAHHNIRLAGNAADQAKIIINVSYRCNNQCSFCAVGDRERTDGTLADQLALIASAYREGVRCLDLDGGEPLLYDHLFTLLDAAVAYHAINITTNGRLLADRALVERLSRYPNLSLLVSLHSAVAHEHCAMTKSPESYSETVSGLRNACALLKDVGVNTTLTQQNWRSLLSTAELAIATGARTFNIQWYTPFGIVDKRHFAGPAAIEQVRRTIEKFAAAVRINLINFTYCQAPDLLPYMTGDYYKSVRRMMFCDGRMVNLSDYLATGRYRSHACSTCPNAIVCPGHWKHGDQHPVPSFGRHQNRRHIERLDIIPGYACNRACTFCTGTADMRRVNLSTAAVFQKIDDALMHCAPAAARIGGGEPTIRRDLPVLIAGLQRRGISQITVQSNGLALSYPEVTNRLIDAGLTGVNLSIPTLDAAQLTELTRVSDSLPLISQAINMLQQQNIALEIDILISRDTLPTLRKTVQTLIDSAIMRINFWYIAPSENTITLNDNRIPSTCEAAEPITPILDGHPNVTFRAFYFPCCAFPRHLSVVWHPREEDTFVVTPDRSFFLEEGEIDTGVFPALCGDCVLRGTCFGIRETSLALFGETGINPFRTRIND